MNLEWLWALLSQLYAGLLWFTPIVAVAAMIFAQRAAYLAAKNNAALESMWILLKAIRQRQEAPSAPDAPKTPE